VEDLSQQCGVAAFDDDNLRTRDFPKTAEGQERSPRVLEFGRISLLLVEGQWLFNIQSCSDLMCCQELEISRKRKGG
jgi:hypothetical protein